MSEPIKTTRVISMDEAVEISRKVCSEGGKAEQWLRDKCNWEHMSRTAVIRCWGDPRKHKALI